jgi:peptidoglycan/xylan/chitin deacetylase (PgdA/CDA1 family)
MFRFKVPDILPSLFPHLLWRVNTARPEIYLTFDDGPHPQITPWVLETLHQYRANGTFFCVGQNVERYPETYERIIAEGHRTGNHTHRHLKGWSHNTTRYVADIHECAGIVKSNLFRPPYGRITPAQIRALHPQYRIVMWDLLSRDYEKNLNVQQALNVLIRKARPGSVLVFHDSEKAEHNLRILLPAILEHFSAKGYTFPCL